MMCSSEDTDLKRLLTTWHCEILYNLFREEDITTEDLKYIKYRHILCLLKNYKMGVRIRFEHYLESWRNKIGIPLQCEGNQIASNHNICSCQHPQQNARIDQEQIQLDNNHVATQKLDFSYAQETVNETNIIENHTILHSPQSISDNILSKTVQMPSSASNSACTEQLLRSSIQRWERAPPSLDVNDNLNASLPAPKTDSSANNNQSIKSRNNFERCTYSLPQILHLSGSRGMAIIKYYEEHHEFTNIQRTQLIQTICDFYEDNDFHLSLHMSHAIETEILQMFPNEKLHNYRTEKRGKLYVKFTNMKRYRRERGIKKGGPDCVSFAMDREDNAVRVQNMAEISSIENNMDTSCDTWPEGAEADINIKTEELDE